MYITKMNQLMLFREIIAVYCDSLGTEITKLVTPPQIQRQSRYLEAQLVSHVNREFVLVSTTKNPEQEFKLGTDHFLPYPCLFISH